jgi:hypothetical protein
MHVEKGPAEIESRGDGEPKGSLAQKFAREEQGPQSSDHTRWCAFAFMVCLGRVHPYLSLSVRRYHP